MARVDAAEIEERVAKLRELLHRDPDDPTSWFTLGRALLDLSRWREAIEAFSHALARNPRYTAAHRDLGRALLEAGEVAEAARVLRSALDLARETGDLQTGREMETFLRRAEKILGGAAPTRSRRTADASHRAAAGGPRTPKRRRSTAAASSTSPTTATTRRSRSTSRRCASIPRSRSRGTDSLSPIARRVISRPRSKLAAA